MKKVDTLKVKQYKNSRLKGKSKTQSLIDTGVRPETANAHVSDSPVVKCGEAELAMELDKKGLIRKAYKTLEDNLSAEKVSDRNTAAIALLDFNEGKKSEVKGAQQTIIIDNIGRLKVDKAGDNPLITDRENVNNPVL